MENLFVALIIIVTAWKITEWSFKDEEKKIKRGRRLEHLKIW